LFRIIVLGDSDIDYGAGGDGGREKNGREFYLGCWSAVAMGDNIEIQFAWYGMGRYALQGGTYQAFIFGEEDCNTSINFAHSQLNEHCGDGCGA
jgi:hypothetical protein